VPTVKKSGSQNLLEPSGLFQVCTGIALEAVNADIKFENRNMLLSVSSLQGE